MICDILDSREDEAWMHAACLHIAEGLHGWDGEFCQTSPAMLAVQKLRRDYENALLRIKELEEHPMMVVTLIDFGNGDTLNTGGDMFDFDPPGYVSSESL